MRFVALSVVLFALLVGGFFDGHARAARPGAIISCQATGQVDYIDPIVSPGVYPTAHRHRFYGAHPVETVETSADLRSKPTTCAVTGNHSGYWMPQVEEDGVDLNPGTTATGGGKQYLVYYRCAHTASVCADITWFPEDFGMVAGSSSAASAADNPVFDNGLGGWRCGTGGGTFYPEPPATCDSGVLVASATYGNCLFPDGSTSSAVNTNCTDHGGRPIVRLQQYFRWWVGTGAVGEITLDGHPAYQMHADADIAWNPETSDAFLARCINANVDCGKNPSLP